jgi:hypothetical protein
MNRYETLTPRMTLAIAAFAMTAITLAVLVLLPAEMRQYDDPTSTLSAIVTIAPTSGQTGAFSANLDSAETLVAARMPCTVTERERAQEL